MKATFLLILMGVASVCAAQKATAAPAEKPAGKKTILPARLLSAKSMCIKILSASRSDVAEAKKELNAWGRFTVVPDCAHADVALWISARALDAGEDSVCHTTVQVIANTDSSVLWSRGVKCVHSTKGTVDRLLQALRSDMASAVEAKSRP